MRGRKWIVVLGGLILVRAATAEPLPTDVNEIRQRTVELRTKYRRLGNDLEARQAIIAEAIRLGPDAAKAIHKLAQQEGEAALKQYGQAFYTAIGQSDRKVAEQVRESSEALQERRAWLIDLVGVTAPLKAYMGREGELQQNTAPADIDALLETPDLAPAEPVLQPAAVDPAEQSRQAQEEFETYLADLEVKAVEQWFKDKNLAELDPEELQAIELTNKEREKAGLAPLKIDRKLCVTARDHSSDMNRLNFFSHESPVEGKKSFSDRAKRFGAVAHGENIAKYPTAAATVDAWMKSPGHKANILNPQFTRIGLGRDGVYFTQLFGR